MSLPKPREVFIQGITKDGRTFRPSDWAERLAGAMSCFRPGGSGGKPGMFIGYFKDDAKTAEVRTADGFGSSICTSVSLIANAQKNFPNGL